MISIQSQIFNNNLFIKGIFIVKIIMPFTKYNIILNKFIFYTSFICTTELGEIRIA